MNGWILAGPTAFCSMNNNVLFGVLIYLTLTRTATIYIAQPLLISGGSVQVLDTRRTYITYIAYPPGV